MRIFLFSILLIWQTFVFAQSNNSQPTRQEVQALIEKLEAEEKALTQEINKVDSLIKQHDVAIKRTDDGIKKIDDIIANTFIPDKIPLLKAIKLTDEEVSQARKKYINEQITWWFENTLEQNLQHQIFVSYMVQVEGIKQQQIESFSAELKQIMWKSFREKQRDNMLNKLDQSTLEVHKIAQHHIFQAWDSALNLYIDKYQLKKGLGFNPGFSLYNYKDKDRIND